MFTVYIRGLNEKPSANTTRRELEQVFADYKCDVVVRKTLALKGQAFVKFDADVADVIAKFDGAEVLGRRISVARAREDSGKKRQRKIAIRRSRPTSTLLVQKLDVVDERVQAYFERFEGFTKLRLIAVRNLAFVEFDSEAAAKKAMSGLGGLEEFGPVEVSYAKE